MTTRDDRETWVYRLAQEEKANGCRDWPWALNNKGYAVMRWEGRVTKVGHVILDLAGRPRPSKSALQLHACDRPICVAPWHLRWGTALDNRRDMDDRGRTRTSTGETNGLAKLTEGQVIAIRTSGGTNVALSKQYGVHKTVIGKIRRGVIWRHLLETQEA